MMIDEVSIEVLHKVSSPSEVNTLIKRNNKYYTILQFLNNHSTYINSTNKNQEDKLTICQHHGNNLSFGLIMNWIKENGYLLDEFYEKFYENPHSRFELDWDIIHMNFSQSELEKDGLGVQQDGH